MTRSQRGITSRPTLPTAIDEALTRPLRKHWSQVQAAFDKWETAVRDAGILKTAAEQAPAQDAAAAREAVANGKEIPPSTVVAAVDAAERKQREADALADIANQQEREFRAALVADRAQVAADARGRLVTAIKDADKALAAAKDAVERASRAAAAWKWARADEPSSHLPSGMPLNVSVAGVDQQAPVFLDAVAKRLAKEQPDEVEDREARLEAEWRASRGLRATSDGLVVDRAAQIAYNR